MGDDSSISRVRYAIDATDKVCFVDDAWGLFADANDGAELTRTTMLGRSLWECISDHTTRNLYQQIVARVRKGQPAQFTLRCDGPSCRRVLEMTIRAMDDGAVEFETRTISAEDREPVALLSRTAVRTTDLLRMCAWCNQVNVGTTTDQWVEVESAIERLRLFEQSGAPQVTHGICEPCLERMMGTIEQMGPVA